MTARGRITRVVICLPFTNTLDASELISSCHECGLPVRRAAGTMPSRFPTRVVCLPCADPEPAVRVIPAGPPAAR